MRHGKHEPWKNYIECYKVVIEVVNHCGGSISDDSNVVKEKLTYYANDPLTKDSVKLWLESNKILNTSVALVSLLVPTNTIRRSPGGTW